MSTVHLGNLNAVAVQPDGQRVPLGAQVTTVSIPDSYTLDEKVRTVTHADGVWGAHSNDPGPVWVECDDENLLGALAQHYGCSVGRPYMIDHDSPIIEGEVR